MFMPPAWPKVDETNVMRHLSSSISPALRTASPAAGGRWLTEKQARAYFGSAR
jgi:hypothetical protein